MVDIRATQRTCHPLKVSQMVLTLHQGGQQPAPSRGSSRMVQAQQPDERTIGAQRSGRALVGWLTPGGGRNDPLADAG